MIRPVCPARAFAIVGLAVLAALAVSLPSSEAADFTTGNLVIYRVGDGSSALSSAAFAVFLDEYTTGGTLVQSIAMPTAVSGSNRRLVASGSATSEGYLTRSVDGYYLVMAGYDAAVGTANIAGTTTATANRVVGRVTSSATTDTTTALTDWASGGNPRGVASTDGYYFWLAGSAGGVRYTTLGATTTTQISSTVTNIRTVSIFASQLYDSSGSAPIRLATVGTGLPTTSGQTMTNLTGLPTSTGSPYAFFFADLDGTVSGVDTLYVADDGGTIKKYSLVSGTWTAAGTSITAASVRGLTGTVSGSTVTLYCTYSAGSRLGTVVDTAGYNANPSTTTVTQLATAGSNTAFRGVAWAPTGTAPTTTDPVGTGAASPSSLLAGESTLLTVAVTPGTNPTSTGLSVMCDLSEILGSGGQLLYDDGTNGDVTAGDGVFSFRATVPAAMSNGTKSLPCEIRDAQLRFGGAMITLHVVTLTQIHDIQGSGTTSPIAQGTEVTTSGVVTGILSNSFFIQEPDTSIDAFTETSEGLYIYMTPPAGLARGDLVRVTGNVKNYRPSAEPLQPPVTELSPAGPVSVVSSGNALPSAVALSMTDTDAAGGFLQLNKYDGMRVSIPSMTVVGPTGGSMSDTTGSSTSDGFYWGVITGIARPFREVGANVLDPLTDCTGICVPADVPRFDGNPERFDVGTKSQVGATALEVRVGDVVTGQVGPLIFHTLPGYRGWEFFPDNGSGTVVHSGPGPAAVSVAGGNEFTVASFNMQHFFASNVGNRGTKALAAIRDYLHMPDILAVEEVDHLTTLQALRDLLNADASAPNYAAYLEEGNDPSNIDVGFLVKTAYVTGTTPRVTVSSVVQEGKDVHFNNPDGISYDLLNDRPPLRLSATVNDDSGASFAVTVIAVHQKALTAVDSMDSYGHGWLDEGARNRAKREAQAEFLAGIIQTRQSAPYNERVIVVGDFNAFEFNDGFVDVMGASTGNPVAANTVEQASLDLIDPNLTILLAATAPERYSYSEGGNAQSLDQMIVNAAVLSAAVVRLEHARIDADFPASDRNDFNSARKVSDHDPLVGFFAVPAFATTDLSVAISGAPAQAPPGSDISYTITVLNAGPDAASGVQLTDVLPAGTTFVSLSSPAGWGCTTPSVGSNGTITCTNPLFAVTSVTFTVTVQIVPGTALGTELYHDVSVAEASPDKASDDNDDGATTITAAGPAAAITATGGTPQSGAILLPYPSPLQATVTDSFGNPVQGVTVTFTAPGTGATGTFPGDVFVATATTDASGVATSPVIQANSVLGSFQVIATAAGVTGTAAFALTNVEGTGIPALGTAGLAAFMILLAGAGVLLLRRLRW